MVGKISGRDGFNTKHNNIYCVEIASLKWVSKKIGQRSKNKGRSLFLFTLSQEAKLLKLLKFIVPGYYELHAAYLLVMRTIPVIWADLILFEFHRNSVSCG